MVIIFSKCKGIIMCMNRHQKTRLQAERKMKLCRAEGLWPCSCNKKKEKKGILKMPADKFFCGPVKQ